MAEFVAFEKDIDVNGQTILAFIHSMERGQEKRKAILSEHGIEPEEGKRYPQQDWLDAFKEVSEVLGEMNLFMIGKAIIDNAQFPPIENLEQGLGSIDIAYHMNHYKNGKPMFDPETGKMLEGIGHYRLESFDAAGKKAVMVCDNPYPSKFDEGIIIQVARRFKPSSSFSVEVVLDSDKESRKTGGESCTYLISW